MGYTRKVGTDLPCKWNDDFIMKIKPQPLHMIFFYKKSVLAKPRKQKKPMPSTADECQQNAFLSMISSLEKPPIALSLFESYSTPFHHKAAIPEKVKLPNDLRNLFSESNTKLPPGDLHTKVNETMRHLQVTPHQIQFLEKSTTAQSTSPLWWQARIGRITASVAHAVLHTDPVKPSNSLMRKLCIPAKRTINAESLKWGRDHETTALDSYQTTQEAFHETCDLKRCGIKISDNFPFLAASGDGFMSCSCHGPRLVEVKCPYGKRDVTSAEELFEDSNFYLDQDGALKKNHPYYMQVQLGMYCWNVNVCDFVVWTPSVVIITSVERDANFVIECIPKLVAFFEMNILPELLTRKLENTQTSVNADKTEAPVLYCYCKIVWDKSSGMIGCDNPNCVYKWIHLTCAGIKRIPKGSWFCRDCRKKISIFHTIVYWEQICPHDNTMITPLYNVTLPIG